MFSHLATLLFGIIVGYSIAYFHFSVDPAAFKGDNHSIATAPAKQTKQAIRPSGIASLEKEINAYVGKEDWKNVISLGKAGLKIQPDFKDALSPILANAYYKQAQNEYDNGQYQAAIKLINDAGSFTEADGNALMLLAQSHLQLKQYNQAKESLSKAEKSATFSPEQIVNLQRKIIANELDTTLAKNDLDQAVHILELELIGDSSYSPYYLQLAQLEFKLKHYKKALENFENAQQLGEQLNSRQKDIYKKAKRRVSFPNAIEVPIESEDSNIYVSVVINDNSPRLRFVMDTGATYTTLTQQVADSLGIASSDGQSVSVSTANGVVPALKTVVDSITVGGARIDSVDVVVLDSLSPNVDGLLGLSFLKHFRVELATDEDLLILKPR